MSHEAISIAGFDPFLTEELSHDTSVKRVQVILTEAPTEQWIASFESARHAARHKGAVEAHVVGNYMAFESRIDDIERHMKSLTEDVAAANAAVLAANAPPPSEPIVSSNTPPEAVMPSMADTAGPGDLPGLLA